MDIIQASHPDISQFADKFNSVWPNVVEVLCKTQIESRIPDSFKSFRRSLEYNVPHGKRWRGLAAVFSFANFTNFEASDEQVELACYLGWALEILQASSLIADDIMDGSITRRGRPCWYRLENVGLSAVNDAIQLENAGYLLLRQKFCGKPYFTKLICLFQDIVFKTTLGQNLDTQMSNDCDFDKFTLDTYKSICDFKTSYYSFYLPVFAGIVMSEIEIEDKILIRLEEILLNMGFYFQMQDDYLDVFGVAETTGKIGSDIVDGKCSWLIVKALKDATKKERETLQNLYKKDEISAAKVKLLFQKMGIEEKLTMVETKLLHQIEKKISKIPGNCGKLILINILQLLSSRNH